MKDAFDNQSSEETKEALYQHPVLSYSVQETYSFQFVIGHNRRLKPQGLDLRATVSKMSLKRNALYSILRCAK